MTTTYVTDHASVEGVLVSWLETYADLKGKVRWLNQVAGRPALPYANLQIISDGVLEGQDAEHQEFNAATGRIDRVTYGPRRLTLQVTIYTAPETDVGTANARNKVNGLLAGLRSQVVKDLLRTNGVAFMQPLGGVRILDEQLGQRWERRAQVDLEFGYLSVFTDQPTVNDLHNWVEATDPINEAAGTLLIQE